MTLRLSRRWLDGAVPPISGTAKLISAFLSEETVEDWSAFTFHDAQWALEQLVHYAALDYIYDDLDEDGSPNSDNDWHHVLHVYEMTAALRTMPAKCPPDIPFY